MKEKHSNKILFYIALVLGAALAAMRTVISRTTLQSGIEMYVHGTTAATALHLALGISAVGLFLCGVLLCMPKHLRAAAEEWKRERKEVAQEKAKKAEAKKAYAALSAPEALARRHEEKQAEAKREKERAKARYAKECARMEKAFAKRSLFVTFMGVFLGIMLLLYDVVLFADMMKTDFSAIAPLLGRAPIGSNTASAVLALLHLISALPAALYFFKAATTHTKPTPGYGILAAAPAIFCLLTTLTLYFQMDVAFNSPTKLVRLTALVSFMLWQVQEGRVLLGIPKRGLFVGFGAAATVLMLCLGISDLILYGMGIISLTGGYIEAAIYIAFGLYTAARCLQHE